MSPTARSRAIEILGLVALLLTLAVWYGSLGPAPALGAYPDSNQLATDYDRYRGEHVSLTGVVVETAPVTIVAGTDTGAPLRLTVTQLSIGVTEGDQLRVYGIVEADHTIRATRALTVSRSGQWYAWEISFLAGVWVLARIRRHWRIDSTDWTLSRRETPSALPLFDRVGNAKYGREDDDA